MSSPASSSPKAYRPVFFVGLGGTGKEVLLRLRLRLYERFRTFDVPFCRFLWVDTDLRATGARGEDLSSALASVAFDEHEKFGLLHGSVGKDLSDVFTNPTQWPHLHEWLYPEVQRYGSEIRDGAGGVRAVGRLTFFAKYVALREALERKLGELSRMETIGETQRFFREHGLPSVVTGGGFSPTVYLVTSLAGGTGCGTFLDTAFLLRDIKAHTGNQADIFAYALLPNVYNASPQGEIAQRSYGNAYAALKELDHFTKRINPAHSQDAKEQNPYSDFIVSWERNRERRVVGPPFSATFLLEITNEANLPISQEHRGDLFSMLAETLFLDLLPGPFSDAKRSDYSNIVEGLSSAAGANIQTGNVHFQQVFGRRYASCGMSKIAVPLDTVRGACAAQLATEIFDYVRREKDDARYGEAVPRDLAANKLDGDGILSSFGPEWRTMITAAVAEAVDGHAVNTPEEIVALRDRLDRAEYDTVLDDADRLGTATRWLRSRTGAVAQEVKERFEFLLGDRILENSERGLATALRKGYFDLLIARTRELIDPSREGESGRFEAERQQLEAEAVQYRQRRDEQLAELNTAVRSVAARALAVREPLIATLLTRVRDHQEQYLFALLHERMAVESRKVAQELLRTMVATRDALLTFLDKADAIRGEAEARLQTYRTRLVTGNHVLFLQLYDPDRDWGRFYKLGLDPDSNHPAAVNPKKEYENLLRDLGLGKGLLGVANELRRQTTAEFSRAVQAFCEKRFYDDMLANPRQVRVLDHPSLRDPASARQTITNFVNAARPMLRRDAKLAATPVESTTFAYLGLSDLDAPATREFVQQVNDFAGCRVEAFDTGQPNEVYLYFSTFAFPLPSLALVQNECHRAYTDFYAQLQPGQAKRPTQGIPLHLSQRWEGRFDDLVAYSDREAALLEEALLVLNLAPALRVLEAQLNRATDMTEFQYRYAKPLNTVQGLGKRTNAVAQLMADHGLRQTLRDAVLAREAALTPGQLKAYFWALYAQTKHPEVEHDSPDFQLLQRSFTQVYYRIQQTLPELLPEVDTDHVPPGNAVAWLQGQNLGLDWSDPRYPALASLEPWRRPVVFQ